MATHEPGRQQGGAETTVRVVGPAWITFLDWADRTSAWQRPLVSPTMLRKNENYSPERPSMTLDSFDTRARLPVTNTSYVIHCLDPVDRVDGWSPPQCRRKVLLDRLAGHRCALVGA